MKKTISILMILMVFLVPTISLANNNEFVSGVNNSGIEFNIKDIKDMEGVKKLSFEEAVEKRMDLENISYDEALEIMLKREEKILQDFAEKEYESNYANMRSLADKEEIINEIKNNIDRRAIIEYVSVVHKFSYSENSSYKAQLEGELTIVQDTSTSYFIDDVVVASRRAAGSAYCDWNETASDYDIAAGKKKVTMWVKGYFDVELSVGVSGGLDIPGFSVEVGATGINYYYSETEKATKVYTVR